jgi:hypothetical protein
MLNDNNRKAELSYAYLHAVAAAAGFACRDTHRHLDGCGVDAQIDVSEQLDPNASLTDFSLHVQLKATSATLPIVGGKLSFSLDVDQYNRLRRKTVSIPKLIVLMTLPETNESWLNVSANELVARHCARWTCIYGAPDSPNATKVTVRFDVNRVLTPLALRDIARLIAIGEDIT